MRQPPRQESGARLNPWCLKLPHPRLGNTLFRSDGDGRHLMYPKVRLPLDLGNKLVQHLHSDPERGRTSNPPVYPNLTGERMPPPMRQPRSTIPAKRSADAAEEAWVADEDRFVLQQSKKRAALRVKGGRAKPIDWLAVTLRFIDPTKNLLDDEVEDDELEIVDPEGVFEGLDERELKELERDVDEFLVLETNRHNRDYWNVSSPLQSQTRSPLT